jgi:hypothetical protein
VLALKVKIKLNYQHNLLNHMLKQIFGGLVITAFILGAGVAIAQTALVASIDAPADGANLTVNQVTTFRASATGGEAPYAFGWNFGDSTNAAGDTFNKAFTSTGSKTVTLTVVDFAGTQVTDTITINVVAGTTSPLTISNISVTDITKTSAVIHWTTNRAATSRVIYDTVSHPDISGASAPNYGYANSTGTSDTDPKVTEHSVSVTGLTADTQYYFRVISEE